MRLDWWFMFPVSIVIAAVAMASGVEGATFFAPIFILGLGLSPAVAIGTGLITEVFGFASGLIAYMRKGLIDYRLGGTLLVVTIPLALIGSWIGGRVDPGILKVVLGVGLVLVAVSFLRAPDEGEKAEVDREAWSVGGRRPERCITPADGVPICYTVVKKGEGRAIAGVGALFMGMISTGLGELNGYFLLRRCRVPSKVAVATSVLVVAVTALVAASAHLVGFMQAGGDELQTVLDVAVFTVPGVVIGGQLGAAIAERIPQHTLEKTLGVLFALIGIFMLGEVLL